MFELRVWKQWPTKTKVVGRALSDCELFAAECADKNQSIKHQSTPRHPPPSPALLTSRSSTRGISWPLVVSAFGALLLSLCNPLGVDNRIWENLHFRPPPPPKRSEGQIVMSACFPGQRPQPAQRPTHAVSVNLLFIFIFMLILLFLFGIHIYIYIHISFFPSFISLFLSSLSLLSFSPLFLSSLAQNRSKPSSRKSRAKNGSNGCLMLLVSREVICAS